MIDFPRRPPEMYTVNSMLRMALAIVVTVSSCVAFPQAFADCSFSNDACPEEFCPRGSSEGRNVNVNAARQGHVKTNVSVEVYGLAFHLASSSCF
jgi:hypothetical protein